jgi:hypothetical protein
MHTSFVLDNYAVRGPRMTQRPGRRIRLLSPAKLSHLRVSDLGAEATFSLVGLLLTSGD